MSKEWVAGASRSYTVISSAARMGSAARRNSRILMGFIVLVPRRRGAAVADRKTLTVDQEILLEAQHLLTRNRKTLTVGRFSRLGTARGELEPPRGASS